jgi:predicted DNA-binding protein (MmcQ/YjbR family)
MMLIEHCLAFPGAYEDYPFGDEAVVLRHAGNRRIFALFLKQGDLELLNLKAEPLKAVALRNAFQAVIPGYHMNKVHWNSVILDGSVPEEALREMIAESYDLTGPKIRKRKIPVYEDPDWDKLG